jgi:DNA-directed RNA polymerase beta' subunit
MAGKKRTKRKYSPKAQEKVKEVMREYKKGDLKIGRSNKKVKSRKQAVAIGLDKARREGAKVPRKKSR